MRNIHHTLLILICCLSFSTSVLAQSDDDIELTDSTSTSWDDGTGGGGLNPQQPTDPVTELTLSQTSVTLVGGETVRLVATVNARAKNKNIVWTSANADIASVEADGTVMGLARGTTTITATAEGNTSLKKTCSVRVTSDYVPPVSGYILPWGKEKAWTMRYQKVGYSMDPGDTAWTRLGYDDKAWPTLIGPMANNDYINNGYASNYYWEGEYNGFNLRCTFNMPTVSADATYTFHTIHDDDLWLYLNGELIAYFNDWSYDQVRSVNIPASKFVRGTNQLALRIMQGSGGCYLDYALYQKSPRTATAMTLPAVPLEFYYNARDYDEGDQSMPNQANASLAGASLTLTGNLPQKMGSGENTFLRISDRCEGYIDRWGKGSTESGAYFFRQGQDCMTIVAKVAPKLDSNSCDFIANRGGGYNYMWRIGDHNRSYLHTAIAYQEDRSLPLLSEQPQVLAVRVDGVNDYILLQNLTTGEQKRISGVQWGGDNNVFKIFYNDGGEYYLGDFYWLYYSFRLLTDSELAQVASATQKKNSSVKGDANGDGTVDVADIATIIDVMAGSADGSSASADVNADGTVDVADIASVIDIMAANARALRESMGEE